jgi:hypothetical protein
LLHDRIDPTVELLRKKQNLKKCKRVEVDKAASMPPAGAPSWCLNREALEKFNRSTENIPLYDYDTDTDESVIQDHNGTDDDVDNDAVNDKNHKRKKKKNKSKSKKNKKSRK